MFILCIIYNYRGKFTHQSASTLLLLRETCVVVRLEWAKSGRGLCQEITIVWNDDTDTVEVFEHGLIASFEWRSRWFVGSSMMMTWGRVRSIFVRATLARSHLRGYRWSDAISHFGWGGLRAWCVFPDIYRDLLWVRPWRSSRGRGRRGLVNRSR